MSKNELWEKYHKLRDLEDPKQGTVDIQDIFNYFNTDDLEGLYQHLCDERSC